MGRLGNSIASAVEANKNDLPMPKTIDCIFRISIGIRVLGTARIVVKVWDLIRHLTLTLPNIIKPRKLVISYVFTFIVFKFCLTHHPVTRPLRQTCTHLSEGERSTASSEWVISGVVSRRVRTSSVVNYLLGYRENPESIDERSIDELFSKVLANSPRSTYPWIEIDVPSDSHAIHFHATKSPKIAWKGSNRTKIKNTSTLDALGSNKNDDEALW